MSERDKRQEEIVRKWIDNKCVGSLVACTGMGKTRTAILAIKYVHNKRPNAKVIVVVPTTYLSNQWKEELAKNNVDLNQVTILVINTACKTISSCDLLIIDEVHVTGADQFSKVFQSITYKAIFCLTATLERADGKEELIKERSPVIDTVDLQEALDKGYISNYKLYNIPIKLDSEEFKQYQKINRLYGYYEHLLGGKYSAWDKANEILKYKTGTQDDTKNALGFIKAVNNRRTFLYNTKGKLELAVKIVNKYPDRKAVVFNESIEFATKILELLPNRATIYHSGLKKEDKKNNILSFTTDPNVMVLSTVRALDTGMDIPNISLGITCSGSSVALQSIQRLN